MIQSMTGFGRAEVSSDGWRCAVELRSVNNRYLDVRVRLPQGLGALEEQLKKLLRGKIERGKIEGSAILAPEGDGKSTLAVNRPALERYAGILNEVSSLLGQPVHLSLSDLMNGREPILTSAWEEQRETAGRLIEDTFALAADGLVAMRQREGEALERDLAARSTLLRGHIRHIAPIAQDLPRVYARRLAENLTKISEGLTLPAERVAQEIALFAERCDISEELTRFNTHLDHLDTMLTQGGALGRKFEFLLQELNREANTLSVKSNDADVSSRVIEIKTELDRLREQIQNIE